MEVMSKSELAEYAFSLEQGIKEGMSDMKRGYLKIGRYAAPLRKQKLYKLLMPEAKNWEHYLSCQDWGIGRAQVDNCIQVALTIGEQLDSRDIPLNRALDITRIVNRLPEAEQEGKIRELIESAEVLPKIGWDDTVKKENGRLPSDECQHLEQEKWSRCKNPNCGKFFKL